MDKENMSYRSPIGARRVKTDLKTFENVFVSPNRLCSRPPHATTSPKLLNNVKTERIGNRLFD